jgi:hypothetical protein
MGSSLLVMICSLSLSGGPLDFASESPLTLSVAVCAALETLGSVAIFLCAWVSSPCTLTWKSPVRTVSLNITHRPLTRSRPLWNRRPSETVALMGFLGVLSVLILSYLDLLSLPMASLAFGWESPCQLGWINLLESSVTLLSFGVLALTRSTRSRRGPYSLLLLICLTCFTFLLFIFFLSQARVCTESSLWVCAQWVFAAAVCLTRAFGVMAVEEALSVVCHLLFASPSSAEVHSFMWVVSQASKGVVSLIALALVFFSSPSATAYLGVVLCSGLIVGVFLLLFYWKRLCFELVLSEKRYNLVCVLNGNLARIR